MSAIDVKILLELVTFIVELWPVSNTYSPGSSVHQQVILR